MDPIDLSTLAGLRDRALLLGFGAATRRSELVALDVEDLDWNASRDDRAPSGGPGEASQGTAAA